MNPSHEDENLHGTQPPDYSASNAPSRQDNHSHVDDPPLGDTLPPGSAMEENGNFSMQDSKNADPDATLPSPDNLIDPAD